LAASAIGDTRSAPLVELSKVDRPLQRRQRPRGWNRRSALEEHATAPTAGVPTKARMATSAAAVPTPPNIAKRLSSNIKHLPRPAKYWLDGQNLLAARPVCQELDHSPCLRRESPAQRVSRSPRAGSHSARGRRVQPLGAGAFRPSGPARSAPRGRRVQPLRTGEQHSARPQVSMAKSVSIDDALWAASPARSRLAHPLWLPRSTCDHPRWVGSPPFTA